MENLWHYQKVLDQTLLGVSFGRYMAVFAILFFSLLLKKILAHLSTRGIFKAAQKTSVALDDEVLKTLIKPAEFVVLVVGIYLAVEVLQLPKQPSDLDAMARNLVQALLIFNLAWFCFNAVPCWKAGSVTGPAVPNRPWTIIWSPLSGRACGFSLFSWGF